MFSHSTNTTSVIVPSCITNVSWLSFSFCPSIKSIVFLGEIKTVYKEAFRNSQSLESVCFQRGVKTIGEEAFKGCLALKTVAIKGNVDNIGDKAFAGCTSLQTISIEGSLISIGMYSFQGCKSLRSVALPKGLKSIGDCAFSGCSSLKNIVIPNGVRFLGAFSFINCTSLETVTVPKSLKELSHQTFNGCISLRNVVLNEGLKSIGNGSFGNCVSLVELNLPDGLNTIGEGAFSNCTALKQIAIPASVTSINGYAFFNLLSLSDVFFCGTKAQWNTLGVNDFSENVTIHFVTPSAFSDVSVLRYYADAVNWAVNKGITSGTGPRVFSPDDGCTRGQVVTFLWRSAGQPKPNVTFNPFDDVVKGDYYYNAVLWAVEKGITAGTTKTTFSPNEICTRGQTAAFIWRATGKPTPVGSANPFKDVGSGEYFYPAVMWAAENGVAAGTGKTTFSPGDTCTRAEVVTFLYRAR